MSFTFKRAMPPVQPVKKKKKLSVMWVYMMKEYQVDKLPQDMQQLRSVSQIIVKRYEARVRNNPEFVLDWSNYFFTFSIERGRPIEYLIDSTKTLQKIYKIGFKMRFYIRPIEDLKRVNPGEYKKHMEVIKESAEAEEHSRRRSDRSKKSWAHRRAGASDSNLVQYPNMP